MDFVGIGCASSGTTWLHSALAEHPEICMPKTKELMFFNKNPLWATQANYHKGLSWLAKQFRHCSGVVVKGEISPIYISCPESAQLIHCHRLDIKLLVSFRNPVDRLYSMYYMLSRLYPLPDTFDEFLQQRPELIASGHYHTLISNYLEFFSRSQFHFILYDDIISDPAQVIRQLYEFLGVTSGYQSRLTAKRINPRRTCRSTLLRNMLGSGAEQLKQGATRMRINSALSTLGVHRLARWIADLNTKPMATPPMNPTVRRWLIDAYADEIRGLERLLGRDLSHWLENVELNNIEK